MNMTVTSSALVVVGPAEVVASSGFAKQQRTVSVDKDVLNDVLEHASEANADPAELQHVVNVVMRALAEYPGELRATIETYTGAIALAVSTGQEIILRLSHNKNGGLEAVPSVPALPAIGNALARGRERVATILAAPEMLNGRDCTAGRRVAANLE